MTLQQTPAPPSSAPSSAPSLAPSAAAAPAPAPEATSPPEATGISEPAGIPVAASAPAGPRTPSDHEEERTRRGDRVNQLRAGVLGANDGIVSVAGLAVGVAGATTDIRWLAISGLASLVAGALSMAMGEYVSVSTQRDTDRALIDRTRADLSSRPAAEHDQLVEALRDTGIPDDVVEPVADSMERHDALTAHTRIRHGVEWDAVVSPLGAAIASLVAFTLGGIIPLLAILLTPPALRVPATMAAVVVALALLGLVSAKLGQANARVATIRTIIGGLLALLVTYGIGSALGIALA